MVCSVFLLGMDCINNLKVKDIRMLLRYHFGSEELKGGPKKVEIVKTVKDFYKGLVSSCTDMREWGVCCNK